MVPEHIDRIRLRWSREDLARYSGVSLASIFLIERLGSSTETDDARIRDTLARGLATQSALPSQPKAETGPLEPMTTPNEEQWPPPRRDPGC